MKTKKIRKVLLLIITGTFSITYSNGQTTGLSGTTANTNAAGILGTDNTNLGANSGNTITSGGNQNTNLGKDAGTAITTADDNTCVGFEAGKANTASENTFIGSGAGSANTSGGSNTFIGFQSGKTNLLGDKNVFNGYQAGYNIGSAYYLGGNNHTFIGYQAGYSCGLNDQEGVINNTFIGSQAGYSTTYAGLNTMVGTSAGYFNTIGNENSFFGDRAGLANTTGSFNTFIGESCGSQNTTGSHNAYVGNSSGVYNITGGYNSILGEMAGRGPITGSNYNYNSIIGYQAGYVLTTGSNNSFLGYQSGYTCASGAGNVAIGMLSLYTNTTSNFNTAIGYQTLFNTTGLGNTALGVNAGIGNTTGTNNTFIGYGADANAGTYSNCAAIGNGAIVTASNKMYMGNSSITHIQGAVMFSVSDGRFKTNVSENVKGLEFINKLRPVTYKMDTKALDDFIIQNMPDSIKTIHQQGMDFAPSMAIVHSGFIAQEVEQAAQEAGFESSIVSTPNNDTDPYALAYGEIVVPLVKAVQELSKTADSLKTKTTSQDSVNIFLQNQINQLTDIINSCCSMPIRTSSNNIISTNNTTIDVNLNNTQSIVLEQNIPNPFAEQTTIDYFLPDNVNKAQMLFYNSQGKLIKSIELIKLGKGQLNVFASDLTNGIYTYSLVVDGKIIETKKMVKQ